MSAAAAYSVAGNFDLSRTTGTLINGDRAQAIIVTSSLTKTFSPGDTKARTNDKASDGTKVN